MGLVATYKMYVWIRFRFYIPEWVRIVNAWRDEDLYETLVDRINIQKGSSRANSDKIRTRLCTEIGLYSINV